MKTCDPWGEHEPAHIPALLLFLDSVVKGDPAPCGFRGSLCVGVRSEDRARWWVACFGATVTTSFEFGMPVGLDVAVGLTAKQADACLWDKATPGSGLVTGDEHVLKTFLTRYFRSHNWLELRASESAEKRGGTRNGN